MVKVGLIGKGKWGKIIDKTINDLSLSDDFFNINFVEPEQADWVIISTPNDLHYEQVMTWLAAGKNVFCEKPLTLSYESAIQLFEFADAMNCKLYVDDVFSWRDDYPIYDDHRAFYNETGIPSIDIIDFDYPYWHTLEDTPDKCSAKTLGIVGHVVSEYLYRKRLLAI